MDLIPSYVVNQVLRIKTTVDVLMKQQTLKTNLKGNVCQLVKREIRAERERKLNFSWQ